MLIFLRPEHHNPGPPDIHALTAYQPIRPTLPPKDKSLADPVQWLKQNSNNRYAVSKSVLPHVPRLRESSRPRAAIISLVRNSELEGMMQSMRQLEFRWNRKYQVISRHRDAMQGLTSSSIHGYSSMMNLSRKSSKLVRGISLRRNVITRLSRGSIGHFQTGLMKTGL
jgi:hypothetical protein